MATPKPSTNVRLANPNRAQRRRTRASPSAATGPKSGPRIIAPITSTWESRMIAIAASSVARLMKLR